MDTKATSCARQVLGLYLERPRQSLASELLFWALQIQRLEGSLTDAGAMDFGVAQGDGGELWYRFCGFDGRILPAGDCRR